MYKLQRSVVTGEISTVQKIMEGVLMSIPFDPANTDYQAYLEWVAAGNTPEPAEDA